MFLDQKRQSRIAWWRAGSNGGVGGEDLSMEEMMAPVQPMSFSAAGAPATHRRYTSVACMLVAVSYLQPSHLQPSYLQPSYLQVSLRVYI